MRNDQSRSRIILSIMGTRPEVIKMAPVIRCLKQSFSGIKSIVCVTGQHHEMLAQMLNTFEIVPDICLDVMTPGQTLSFLTARLFESLGRVMKEVKPDWVLAQGDTTTVFAAAITAYYHKVRFAHVEAGLRTGDLQSPFPEEMNRRLADIISTLCFAPTEKAMQNLLQEGCSPERVMLTGNTVVDALTEIVSRGYDWHSGPLAVVPQTRRLVMVTAHRRESFGEPIRQIGAAIRRIAEETKNEGVHLVYPVHLNPEIRNPMLQLLNDVPNVTLLQPLPYIDLVQLMKRSELILTDSGGIQEEAPSLGVPVLVMRDKTERPEGIEAGVALLVGTTVDSIVQSAISLLRDPEKRRRMMSAKNPYGDGKAAERIVSAIISKSLR